MNTHPHEATRDRQAPDTSARPQYAELDEAVAVFIDARPGLLRIARRIIGDTGDAEEVIQETWLRWQGTDRTVVRNPSALLRTTTARLAINVVQSARRRREFSLSPWLPESPDTTATPEATAEEQAAVEHAVRLLMEALTPRQRAVYVLREGFGYPYARISEILQLSAAAARQQVSRAQERLGADRRRRPVDAAAHRRLVQAFLGAARSGDLARLEEILRADGGLLPSPEPALSAVA